MSAPPKDDPTAVILFWWRELYHDPEKGHRGDAGGRARLRRAGTILEVMCEEAFNDLVTTMQEKAGEAGLALDDAQSDFWRRAALAAAVLAERKLTDSDRNRPFAGALGHVMEGETRPMSELRFNALMKAMTHGEPDEKLRALRRAMALLGDAGFNIGNFVRDLLHFDDRTRIDWVFAYFHTPRHGDAEPGATRQDQKETAL
jgi:CRISPR type I-E-associated protein CasB/Cse2